MPPRSVFAFLITPLTLAAALSSAGPGQTAPAAPDLPALRAAAAQNPEDPAAANRLGLALLQSGDTRGAVSSFTLALALFPASSAYLGNRARAYASLGETSLALADLRRALQLRPGDRALLAQQARLQAGNSRPAGDPIADQDRIAAASLAQEDRLQTRNGVSRTVVREAYYGNPARYSSNGQFLPLTNFTLAAIEAARRAQDQSPRDGLGPVFPIR